ncbi:ETO1-like protein 1 [Camellia lanceoleosa]|uniref:ETO1-like protein 1 n=1 Tax=Camellia lanceoleosa TaxID=1840588 RepID=A0ACC0FW90_9ERIC|nr:ETO1-like protein 1 [Camellia lanceoleosa]
MALNNLGSVYVDCGKLDLAADCYIDALKIRHTRAHQGLARVHFLRNNKTAAYEEMTKLIEKAQNNVSAYEKRYRAAVLMDNHKEKEAIAELSKAIAFKADLNLLHLRAAFHEHIGDVMGALRDYRVAVSVDPNHEMLELHSSREP